MLTEGVLMRLSRENFEKLLKEPVLKSIEFEQAVMLVGSGAEWLDVRLESEYHNNPFPNSINIPLSSLRSQMANIDRNKPYIVCCETGRRSSIAAYLLHERGFEVYLLDGGIRNQHANASG
jgi:rhodanese-related sulfurtransferase